jgi:hypothetical protein
MIVDVEGALVVKLNFEALFGLPVDNGIKTIAGAARFCRGGLLRQCLL